MHYVAHKKCKIVLWSPTTSTVCPTHPIMLQQLLLKTLAVSLCRHYFHFLAMCYFWPNNIRYMPVTMRHNAMSFMVYRDKTEGTVCIYYVTVGRIPNIRSAYKLKATLTNKLIVVFLSILQCDIDSTVLLQCFLLFLSHLCKLTQIFFFCSKFFFFSCTKRKCSVQLKPLKITVHIEQFMATFWNK